MPSPFPALSHEEASSKRRLLFVRAHPFLTVFVLALIVRVINVALLRGNNAFFAESDAVTYWAMGHALAQHSGFWPTLAAEVDLQSIRRNPGRDVVGRRVQLSQRHQRRGLSDDGHNCRRGRRLVFTWRFAGLHRLSNRGNGRSWPGVLNARLRTRRF